MKVHQTSISEIAIITAGVAFVLTVYLMDNPPELMSILAIILTGAGFAGAIGFAVKGRERVRGFAIVGVIFWAATVLPLIRFPINAVIVVPNQCRTEVEMLVNKAKIPVVRHPAVNFNCLEYFSKGKSGWMVWFYQSTLLNDARANGYYCEITYTPVLKSFSWCRSTGDSRMVGLH